MNNTICVVDDDELLRAYIVQLLEPEGFVVIEAADAQTAIRRVAEHQPFATLIDVIMPDCDGLELIAQMRRERPQMRIVAMSSGGRLGPRVFLETAKRMGADAALSKPIAREALLQALDGGPAR